MARVLVMAFLDAVMPIRFLASGSQDFAHTPRTQTDGRALCNRTTARIKSGVKSIRSRALSPTDSQSDRTHDREKTMALGSVQTEGEISPFW
jgi:hypothetical protein